MLIGINRHFAFLENPSRDTTAWPVAARRFTERVTRPARFKQIKTFNPLVKIVTRLVKPTFRYTCIYIFSIFLKINAFKTPLSTRNCKTAKLHVRTICDIATK